MRPRRLEVTFNATGAADAGTRGRVVAVVDVVDSGTSAEAAVAAGAGEVLGAAPAGLRVPARVDPGAVGRRAAAAAGRLGSDVLVVAEPRTGTHDEQRSRCLPVLQALRTAGVAYELLPNQGAELPRLVDVRNRVVVVVSATGGTAFDAALIAGAPAVCFATTGRVEGLTGWEVAEMGAQRAVALAEEHQADLTVVAATANSADDVLGAFELARAVIGRGFLRLDDRPTGPA
ncbi:MAG TPA: hypothetical protein VHL78_09885 [Actinomycetota bacterium]|nr:hypothetical protein [Actinomycetota bacterium]